MDRFIGDVVFYKNIEYGYIGCTNVDSGEGLSSYLAKDNVVIGRISVDVELNTDTRKEEIEALEKTLKKGRADHHLWCQTILGQIESLRAIEHKTEAA